MDQESSIPINEPVELEIFFHDLHPDTQETIADMMGCEVHEVEKHTNWDNIPMTHVFVEPLTEEERE